MRPLKASADESASVRFGWKADMSVERVFFRPEPRQVGKRHGGDYGKHGFEGKTLDTRPHPVNYRYLYSEVHQ